MPQVTLEQAMHVAATHHSAGRLAEAEAVCVHILSSWPNNMEALYLLGSVWQGQNKLNQAIACYQRLTALRPDLAAAHFNMGNAWKDKGRLDRAIACYQGAIAADPRYREAHVNLGIALHQSGQIDSSIACLQRAVELNPQSAEAHFNLGKACASNADFDRAMACYRLAVQLNPNYVEAHNNLGVLLAEQGHPQQAVECYRTAIAINPEFAGAHYNLAHVLLRGGDLAQGWEQYQWRWKCPGLEAPRVLSRPAWDGSDLPDGTILLTSEQGLGDTIQFIRYAPLVAARCRRVVLQCQEELLPLLDGTEGIAQVVRHSDALPEFDAHCPLLNLPGIFSTTIQSIPSHIPYVHAHRERIEAWSGRIDGQTRPRIGLAWAGRPENRNDRHRSLPLSALAALGQISGAVFYSLQKGPASQQAASPPTGMRLIDLTGELNDFADTAGLIANLDLVISVDTAVVHLAGAMGRPVWTLLPFCPDWRWLLDRNDSPWYPTMRLFRQATIGDWTGVIEQVVDALRQWIGEHPAGR